MTCFKGQVEVCFPTQSHFGSIQYGFSYLKLRYFLASCSIPLSQCQSPSLYTSMNVSKRGSDAEVKLNWREVSMLRCGLGLENSGLGGVVGDEGCSVGD